MLKAWKLIRMLGDSFMEGKILLLNGFDLILKDL